MIQFIKITNQLNEWMGKAANWVATFLVLLICLDVSMRYIFKFSSVAVYELEWHLFSIIFLFGAGYTLKKDKHVRVDIFYAKMSPQKKAIVNLLGYLLFLIPFCIIIMKGCVPYIKVSYLMHEKSTDPGGLPMRYASKSLILIGFFFLLMQGIAQTFQSILCIMGKKVELK